jgi:DNA invertase Pin-like site-specific DNA recombinase
MGLQIVKESDSTPRKVLAAVYSRVSTIGHGQDPAMQTRELREYCERPGWQVFDLYVDEGVSGRKDSRPELNRLMADAHARRFDVVVDWRFDRFSRLVSHLCRALDTVHALKIDFVSMIEQIDTATPAGTFVFHVLAAVLQSERETTVECVRTGLRNARAKGKRLGRPSKPVDVGQITHSEPQGIRGAR